MDGPEKHPDADTPQRRSVGPRRSEATHQAVIAAAEALLSEKGVPGVTFEAVARRAGAGKPTLYRWWPNRTALLLEIYDRRKMDVLGRPDTGRLADDLIALIGDLWRFWRDGPAGAAYAAIIIEAHDDPAARARIAAQLEDPDFPLSPIFARAVARGELADRREAEILREYVAAMNWFRLLTGRLDEADIPAQIATLLAGRGSRR